MSRSQRFNPVLRYLRRLTGPPASGRPTDGELLLRFARQRDEAAFVLLLDRYGGMVLGLCQRMLRNYHDAEDAFQATFLVLARKAGSIRRPHLLGNWLYGVAYRTALKARSDASRRRGRERMVPARPEAFSPEDTYTADLGPVLDEEVSRLPEKYRTAFVLCCLEGRTNAEAAQQLGCPVGTVLSRLARARQQLRSRLRRRGVTLAAGGVSIDGSMQALSAAVPVAVREAVVRVAVSFADAAGMVSTSSIALAEGVLHAMFLSQLKVSGVAILMLSLIFVPLGLAAFRTQAEHGGPLARPALPAAKQAEPPAPPPKAAPPEGEPTKLVASIRLKALLKERLEAAQREWDGRYKEFLIGRGTLDFLFGASRRLLEANREMSDRKEEQVAAFEGHMNRMKEVEKVNKERFQAGRIVHMDYDQATYYRAEAEIWLERARAK